MRRRLLSATAPLLLSALLAAAAAWPDGQQPRRGAAAALSGRVAAASLAAAATLGGDPGAHEAVIRAACVECALARGDTAGRVGAARYDKVEAFGRTHAVNWQSLIHTIEGCGLGQCCEFDL